MYSNRSIALRTLALGARIRHKTPVGEPERRLGERLLDVSGIYGGAAFERGIGAGRVALVGLVARARRFLRAMHHMIDAGDTLEAQLMARALIEYAITFAWFKVEPEHHLRLWMIEDIRQTLLLDKELNELEGEGVLDETKRRELETLSNELKEACGKKGTSRPSVKDQAKQAGVDLVYSLGYRFESKSGIHPTTLAAEQMLKYCPEARMYEIREDPPGDLDLPNIEAVGAALLLAILQVAHELVPEMKLDDGFDEVANEIAALAPQVGA